MPESIASETLTASYNDLDSVKRLFTQYPDQIAAVIVEPIAGNMGLVPPAEGFLQGLREITKEYGALLIFDEVISGFRASYGGAQKVFDIMPDLTCLGKIIGGGLPVGAYGGRKEIMFGCKSGSSNMPVLPAQSYTSFLLYTKVVHSMIAE